MGVKFKDIVSPEEISLKDLEGRTVAIDAYNTIYQFLSGIRQRDGSPLMDQNGNVTSHLSGILYRTASIVDKGIKPIYVFDGDSSEHKAKTIEQRKAIKEEAMEKWEEAKAAGNIEEARKFAIRTSRMSPYILESSKKLLDYMGIPYVQAKGEGEAQGAYMVEQGDAWAVASQDYDCLLFGAPRIIRNLTLSGGLSNLEYLELQKVLEDIDLTREQLIDVALMVGTDFNEGIHGIGAKTGLKLIRNNTLEDILVQKGITEVNVEPDELRDIFLKHDVNTDYEIKFKSAKKDKLVEFMCEEHGFSESRVLNVTEKLKKLSSTQKSLEDWF
ncbi:MAG: flap endonuclease-1 [Methanobrevibacter ruminantium]|uniref:flap endonuclease-1 n=1 Tax=Methanobrevibacter ruminantium TaxID=83816 RepID=UPI0026EC00AF|nr:flap endonuclease-1 [Methanobrevibacter ruminantium]MDD6049042.1 flap endonuclease-1 [Methanobrevibacter ruminantium]MDO5842416.1 flap endonuclease-1 [Methanobrevibacter ruminantium]